MIRTHCRALQGWVVKVRTTCWKEWSLRKTWTGSTLPNFLAAQRNFHSLIVGRVRMSECGANVLNSSYTRLLIVRMRVLLVLSITP